MIIKSVLSVARGRQCYLHQSVASHGVDIYNKPPVLQPLSVSLHTSPPASGALATLRKNTGYSLSICKKALSETNQDVAEAERWLREQAQAQGWAKAQKLQGRNTSQGLLGVLLSGQSAALVQLNCETDFVAKNEQFVSLLKHVAEGCLLTASSSDQQWVSSQVSKDVVGGLDSCQPGKTIGDLVALNIGQIGENMTLGEASLFSAGPGVRLAAQCHPSVSSQPGWVCGRYAAILAYTNQGDLPGDQENTLVKQLCQHIVGMAPTQLDDEKDSENSLMHQAFLMDEDRKVREVLEEAGISIVNFVRTELGRGTTE